MRKIFFLFVLLLVNNALMGQEKRDVGTLQGKVVLVEFNEKQKAMDTKNVDGAICLLISEKDTLRAYSITNGSFLFKKVPVGKYKLIVSFVGCKEFKVDIEIKKGETTKVMAQLELNVFDITQVTVAGDIPLTYMKGDTIMINPAATKTMEGDRAIEILYQIQGVEVKDGAITVNGEHIVRTFLNKRLIFGDNALTPFVYLPANEVKDIQVYDVDNPEYSIYGEKTEKKLKVMNIISYRDIANMLSGHLVAEYGKDLLDEKDVDNKERYRVGASVNFFSEGFRGYMNLYTNNINKAGNDLGYLPGETEQLLSGSNKVTHLSIDLERVTGLKSVPLYGTTHYNFGYAYKNISTESVSSQLYDYSISKEMANRIFESTNIGELDRIIHYLNFRCYKPMSPNTFDVQIHADFEDKESYSIANQIVRDDNINNRVVSLKESDSRAYNIESTLLLRFRWLKNFTFNPTAKFHNSRGTTYRIDTTSTMEGVEQFKSSPLGKTRYIGFKANTLIPLGILLVSLDNRVERTNNLRYITSNGNPVALDSLNSVLSTYSYTDAVIELSHIINSNKTNLSFNVKYSHLNKDEDLPEVYCGGKNFYSVGYNFSTKLYSSQHAGKNGMVRNEMSVTLNSSAGLPSLEQLSPVVNDKNPMFLTTGNPDLRQTYTNHLAFGWLYNGFSISLSGDYVLNAFANDISYFKEDMCLEKYGGYEVRKGSALTTYSNVNKVNGGISFSLDKKLYKTTRAQLTLRQDYFYSPYFIDGSKQRVNMLTSSAKGSIYMPLSKKGRFTLSLTSSYNHRYDKGGNDFDYFSNVIGSTFKYNFLKRMFVDLNYSHSDYFANHNSANNLSTDILNAELGTKVLKKKLAVSLYVRDLFNSTKHYSQMITPQYINNSYTMGISRFIVFRLVYSFDNIKGSDFSFRKEAGFDSQHEMYKYSM